MRAFWILLLALALGGCTTVGRFNGLRLNDDALYVSGVTPVLQDKSHACGPACIAAVALYWGVNLDEFKASQPHLAEDATGHDLQVLAEKFGLQAFPFRGSMETLRQNLASGRPMIVMLPMPIVPQGGWVTGLVLNTWNEVGPRPAHWVVVVGAIKDKQVIINDPASGPIVVRQDKFVDWWAQKDNLCVLIVARGEQPAAGTIRSDR